ncbi:hypothetical protein LEL_10429 [Akanthomyces lecanii RCEF 1005]|uniref:Uncharacterized protein n=1 Tax=Akanthomyces lecanii RCEF 1005 TaxID=1081108 RepID=A0A162MSN5_CORDF|nr:hypothetical protein LEL_10429 [Akanthomyces lecanii RCEF 1005]
MALDFRTDLLGGDKEFHVPLAFVNQEARGIALCWLDEQGITIKQSQPRRCLFKRPFDRASDTLYVPDNKWDDFCEEPSDRIGEPDLVNQSVDVNGEISRIAVSETLYMKDDVIRWLPGLNSWWDVIVIFVVVGAQPDPQQGSCRWELEGTDGRAIVWYRKTQDFEVQQGTSNIVEEDLHRKIEQLARANLEEQQSFQSLPTLEIRPVTINRVQQ